MTANFWDTGDGEVVQKQDTIEVEGGNSGLMPIPARTQVKIGIQEAKWETSDGDGTYINLKHQVLAPECYKGRIVFQKLHVNPLATSPNNKSLTEEKLRKKKAKALRMLGVIDTNAGGKLLSSPQAPTDETLTLHLVNKTMMMELDVYEFDHKDGVKIPNPVDYMRGNWVKKVAPKSAFVDMTKDEQAAAVEKTKQEYAALLAQGPSQREQPAARQQARPAGQQSSPAAASTSFDEFDDDIPF